MRTTLALGALLPFLLAALDAAAESKPAKLVFTAQDKSDIAEIRKRFPPDQRRGFNLADPVEKRFALRMLELAGYTPERYPETFRVLRAAGKPPAKAKAAAAAAGSGPIAFNELLDIRTNDQQSFQSDALSTVPGGTDLTLLTLVVADQNDTPIGETGRTQVSGQGQNVTVRASGQFANPPPAGGQMVHIIGEYFYSKQGQPFSGPLLAQSQTTPVQINNLAPVAISNPNLISLCLNRQGGTSGCDYACNLGFNCTQTSNTGNPPNVIFPVQGNIVFPGNIDPITYDQQGNPTNAFSLITVAFTAVGGVCSQNLQQNFFKDPNTTIVGPTLSWNFNPAQFGVACYPSSSPSTYAFSVYVSVNGLPIYAFINNTGNTPTKSTLTIPATQIVIGCVGAGSRVRLADGSERVIDTFDGGERVSADAAGRALTVQGTLWGNEAAPMIRIKTKSGESLLLTEGHPVVTARGVVVARRLKAGDEVTTLKGKAKLASVTKERSKEKVFNLTLGKPDEGPLTHENTTFFANGILVGDTRMQDYWEDEDRRDKRSILERVPKAWHKDALSAIEDSAATR